MGLPKLFIKRIFKKSGPPIHLIWFITAKCDLGCAHCFYHGRQAGGADELTPADIEKTVSNLTPLLSVTLTGGEPFLREDLPRIAALLYKKRITKNLVLFSNGFETGNILEASEKILADCRNADIFIGISVDGFEKEHDLYRNRAGSYRKALDTVRGLKALKTRFSNLIVGVSVTLHGGNQDIVADLRKDIYSRFGIIPGVTLIRGSVRSPALKRVDSGIYKEIVKAVERDRKACRKENLARAILATREILGQRLAYKTFMTRSRSYDCYAGSLMGVVYENGDVYPCETLDGLKMGNLRDYGHDINRIWQSPGAEGARRFIKKRKCFCTYECQYTCNTLYNIGMSRHFVAGALDYLSKKIKPTVSV